MCDSVRLGNKHSIVHRKTSHKTLHDHVFVLVKIQVFFIHTNRKKRNVFFSFFSHFNPYTNLQMPKYFAANKEALVEIVWFCFLI